MVGACWSVGQVSGKLKYQLKTYTMIRSIKEESTSTGSHLLNF